MKTLFLAAVLALGLTACDAAPAPATNVDVECTEGSCSRTPTDPQEN